MEKQNEKTPSTFIKIINSPISIIVVLMLLSIGLMIYTRYLVNNTTLYNFSAYEKDVSILNGTIYTGYDINYFGDSKIIYTGEEVRLKSYTAGYFIKDGEEYREISVVEGIDDLEESASLKEVITKTDFSFTEAHKEAKFLSKENVTSLENLVFKIEGIDESEEEFKLEIPLVVSKITK